MASMVRLFIKTKIQNVKRRQIQRWDTMNQICWHQKPTCWHPNQRKFLERWVESPLKYLLYAILATFFPKIPIRLESRPPCQKRGQKTTWNEFSNGESEAMPGGAWFEERGNLFTKFGISGQIRMPMKEKKSKKHPGNWCYPTRIQKSDILKRVDKSMFRREDQNQAESDERECSNSTSSRKLAAHHQK